MTWDELAGHGGFGFGEYRVGWYGSNKSVCEVSCVREKRVRFEFVVAVVTDCRSERSADFDVSVCFNEDRLRAREDSKLALLGERFKRRCWPHQRPFSGPQLKSGSWAIQSAVTATHVDLRECPSMSLDKAGLKAECL